MSSEEEKAKMRGRRNSLFKELNKDHYKPKKHRSRVKYSRAKRITIDKEDLLDYDDT